jgi:hypothetical protein
VVGAAEGPSGVDAAGVPSGVGACGAGAALLVPDPLSDGSGWSSLQAVMAKTSSRIPAVACAVR